MITEMLAIKVKKVPNESDIRSLAVPCLKTRGRLKYRI